jgi:hypothetical protein
MEEGKFTWLWDANVILQGKVYSVNVTLATMKAKDSVTSKKTVYFPVYKMLIWT